MTPKFATFSKAALAVTMLMSSVAFAQNTSSVAPPGCNSFIPADAVVGEGAGSRSAVCSGVGGLSNTAIAVAAVVGALAIAAAASGNNSSGITGTTGSK